MIHADFRRKISALRGPILVLGASGFVGANLLRVIRSVREDAYGTAFGLPAWRLEDLPKSSVLGVDLLVPSNLERVFHDVKPGTVLDCIAYGAYSFEKDATRIYETNINLKVRLIELMCSQGTYCYIHAGSSSEYGAHSDRPSETEALLPNSHYAVTKAASSGLIYFAGKHRGLRCANLRLYSVYGPLEERSRLIPTLVAEGLKGKYPPLVDPDISRDFVYVDDVSEAFVDAALSLNSADYGESFNIGTGTATTIRELANLAQDIFHIQDSAEFSSMRQREWDVNNRWCADAIRAKDRLGWMPRTTLREGLLLTANWYKSLPDPEMYERRAKGFQPNPDESVTAIIACYKDGEAIPIMYDRLVRVFEKLHLDYEIIFVNDGSPDNSQDVIRQLSQRNHRVIGITHSRNFGSQSAFRSGLEIASRKACVLLDGDLQDPPELIEQFVEKWRDGFDVVYGRRIKREATWWMQFAYKLFYRIFEKFSYVRVPRDAGDFSLIDRKVVRWILECRERDLFLRGLRAYVGFRQTGVDYVRPERMFGRSTNNLLKNIGWAKKGILSFSNAPLNAMTFAGVLLFLTGMFLSVLQVTARLLFPSAAPKGVTTVILLILVLGSLNLLAVSIVGEYIAKIFEEVKARPHFIRMHVIQNGDVRKAQIEREY